MAEENDTYGKENVFPFEFGLIVRTGGTKMFILT